MLWRRARQPQRGDATVARYGGQKKREIDAEDFFLDLFATALKPAEILTSVFVPAETAAVYLKHRHPASSFAVVGVAALVSMKKGKCDRVAVAVGPPLKTNRFGSHYTDSGGLAAARMVNSEM